MTADSLRFALEGGSFADLMSTAFAPESTSASEGGAPAMAHRFRQALALRGRTHPAELLAQLGANESSWGEILDLVISDCDTGAGPERGQWLLSDRARRTEIESLDRAALLEKLSAIINPDDVTRSLLFVFRGGFKLGELKTAELKSLLAIEPAVPKAPYFPLGAEIRRLLALNSRIDEFEQFVGNEFVGRSEELDALLRFARPDRSSARGVSSLLLWGTGGIGKSTLVSAALSRLMRERSSHVVPVHLDFDRRDLTAEDSVTLSLELLRQVGVMDAKMDDLLKKKRDELRTFLRRRLDDPSYASHESSSQEAMSMLRGCLVRLKMERRVIVLVFDTFENVEVSGRPTLRALRRWVDQIVQVAGAYGIRLIIAGRSDPSRNGASEILGWKKPLVKHLDDLSRRDACGMLVASGIPLAVAESLYTCLGGNPLVLSLVKRLFRMEDGVAEMEQVAADVRNNKIPPSLLQGVLYDRFLKHLRSDDARNYAHPGLVLPELTPLLIRSVLAPLKGEPRMTFERAKQIFDELASASWLVHLEDGTLVQRSDVRRLMLKLMTADPDRGAEIKRVRLAALLHHAKSKSVADRAALAYHLLMRVDTTEDLALLDTLNVSGIGPFIRRRIDDYPETARAFVDVVDFESGNGPGKRVVAQTSIPAEQALDKLPNDLWESFIAGSGSSGGEGDRLCELGDPAVALDLWRRRPVGAAGKPPTFVLRALAETGQWDTHEIDLNALIQELARQMPSTGKIRSSAFERRLYWTTAFALMSHPSGFSGQAPAFGALIKLLGKVNSSLQKSASSSDLVALTGVAEGLSQKEILPGHCFSSGSPFASLTRLHLQRGRWGGRVLEWTIELDFVVTLQKDFASRFSRDQDVVRIGAQTVFQSQSTGPTASALRSVQHSIDALNGRPIDETTKVSFKKLKATVRSGKHEGTNHALEALLLRGQTPELYRPARDALIEGLIGAGGEEPGKEDVERVRKFAADIAPLLSVRPREFEPRWFAAQASKDAKGAFLSLVQYADRARVLEELLAAALQRAVEPLKIARVSATLKAWDVALAGDADCCWVRRAERRAVPSDEPPNDQSSR